MCEHGVFKHNIYETDGKNLLCQSMRTQTYYYLSWVSEVTED